LKAGTSRGTTAKHAGTGKHVHGKGKHHPRKPPAAAGLHHARKRGAR
jgi:hypothetical protein